MNKRLSSTGTASAFSAVEVVLVITILGILFGLGIGFYRNVGSSAQTTKLVSDVGTLNRTVDAYLSSGGDLGSVKTLQEALDHLKREAANPETVPGYVGAFVDQRLEIVPMAADEVNQAIQRVTWDEKKLRFVLTKAAVNGAKGFRLTSALAKELPVKEERSVRFAFASHNSWIWDYNDTKVDRPAPDDPITLEDVYEDGAPPYAAPLAQLQPPFFQTPGGSYTYDEYPLSVVIENPNPLEGSQLMYAINGGSWLPYEGPVPVQPDQQVSAFVRATTEKSYSSLSTHSYYAATPQTFAGETDGEFYDASGPPNLKLIYGDGFFEWGTPSGKTRGSFLEFTGTSFDEITADEFFYLGSLTFFNSIISSGAGEGANPHINNSVTMRVDLNLTSPAHQEFFDFELEMINTLNHPLYTTDEQADYVLINNPINNFSTLLNGKQYALEMSFAYIGTQGYSTVNEFHVHEGAETKADLMGRFIEMELETE